MLQVKDGEARRMTNMYSQSVYPFFFDVFGTQKCALVFIPTKWQGILKSNKIIEHNSSTEEFSLGKTDNNSLSGFLQATTDAQTTTI